MMKLTILLAVFEVAIAAHFRPRLDGRIVGGHDVNIEDFSHQLSLRSYGQHICGASIIGKNWVLTAAHCVDGAEAEEISFRAGSTYNNKGGSIHNAVQITVHPKYNRRTIDFDFALVQVEESFELGQAGVNAISLTDEEPTEGGVLTVSGWGTTSSGGSLPLHLKAVDVHVVSRDDCDAAYGGITERMICAADPGKDSCQGDSGGPLINKNGTQVGVVSWGAGCAEAGYPGVYSNIANQIEWIREQTSK